MGPSGARSLPPSCAYRTELNVGCVDAAPAGGPAEGSARPNSFLRTRAV